MSKELKAETYHKVKRLIELLNEAEEENKKLRLDNENQRERLVYLSALLYEKTGELH